MTIDEVKPEVMMEKEVTVEVKLSVSLRDLRCLLISALEGGSNYWYFCHDDRTIFPEGVTNDDFCEGGRFTDPDNYYHPLELIPFHPGCKLIFTSAEVEEGDEQYGKEYYLDREALERGIQVMAEKYPHHFKDVLADDCDADTGDTYLQCCLFGEAVYG